MAHVTQLLVIGEDKLYDEVQAALASSEQRGRFVTRHATSVRSGIETARGLHPHVIIFDLERDIPRAQATVRELLAAAPDTKLAAAFRPRSGESRLDSQMLIEIVRCGVSDFLQRPLSTYELQALLERIGATKQFVRAQLGQVITFSSNKGGVGKSTLSANVAAVLGQRHPNEVLLIDASLHLGTLADMLDLRTQTSIIDAAKQEGRLDETLLRRLTSLHSSGLHLLAAPKSPMDADLTDEALAYIINVARRVYRYIIVDTFPVVDSLVICALDFSSLVYIVTEATVPTIIGTSTFLELCRSLGYSGSMLRVVVNRYAGKESNLQPEMLEARIGRPIDYLLPFTREALKAMNLGVPLALSNSKLETTLSGWLPWKRPAAEFISEIHRMVDEIETLTASSARTESTNPASSNIVQLEDRRVGNL